MLALLVAALLTDGPAPSSPPPPDPAPKARRQCYLPHADWTAKEGEAMKGVAKCMPGYIQGHAKLDLGDGTTVEVVICCPAVDSAESPPKKEK